jgi:hypothetical protein
MAEQRKTLMMSMTKKRIPKATHRYNIQGGLEPQSLHTLSTSEKQKIRFMFLKLV